MAECKFLNENCKCSIMVDFSYPTGSSVMGYCMATAENKSEECNWFTEVE